MKQFFFFALWFYIITICACQAPSNSTTYSSNVGKLIYTVVNKGLSWSFAAIKPTTTIPLKLTWNTTLGLILIPISFPVSLTVSTFRKINHIISGLIDDVRKAPAQATKELVKEIANATANSLSATVPPTMPPPSEKRRKRSTTEVAQSVEGNVMDTVKVFITTVMGFIGQKGDTADILKDFITVSQWIEPIIIYTRDSLIPNVMRELNKVEHSPKVSVNTVNKIKNIKEGYKILSLIGYLPPLNIS